MWSGKSNDIPLMVYAATVKRFWRQDVYSCLYALVTKCFFSLRRKLTLAADSTHCTLALWLKSAGDITVHKHLTIEVNSLEHCCNPLSNPISSKVISELSSRQSTVPGQSRIWSGSRCLCSRRSASNPDSQAHREPPCGRSYIWYALDGFFLFQITCPDIDLILIQCKWGAWVFFS